MKKTLGLSAAILFLLFSLYSLATLVSYAIRYTSPSPARLIMPFFLIGLGILGIVLCLLCFRKHLFGRFDSDIITTVYLFLVFMLSFLVAGELNMHYPAIRGYFPVIGAFVATLGENGIGIYEGSFFVATICCGLTIGHGKQKEYYE